MINFRKYIKSIRAEGRHAFTRDEAISRLGISGNAFSCGMYKLKRQGDIISPAKNLYVIIPPENQSIGCLQADELVPILMKHWGLKYYVCLLSAALYHGASHQKPQIFQVVTNKQLKPMQCGKVKIEFIYRKTLENLPTQKQVVKTGYLIIATSELTAMDILIYSYHVGGLNHVATILSELIEAIDLEKLIEFVRNSKEKAWIQRLGYILEHIESMEPVKQSRIVELLYQYINEQPYYFVPLAPELLVKGKNRDLRWKIIENTTIESDL
jgi:predicted transcriptional regulator of viral defense system